MNYKNFRMNCIKDKKKLYIHQRNRCVLWSELDILPAFIIILILNLNLSLYYFNLMLKPYSFKLK